MTMKKSVKIFLLCFLGFWQVSAKFVDSESEKNESERVWDPEVAKEADGQPVRWIHDLGLDEKQKEEIKRLWTKNRGDVKLRRQELTKLREELMKMVAGTTAADEVMAQHKRIQNLQSELGTIDMVSMLAIRDLLTAQQREKFVKHMALRGRLGGFYQRNHFPEKP